MKINWKSELTAALAAFALTGVAVWGSMIPIHTGPVMPARQSTFVQIASLDTGMADTIREGSNA